MMKTLISICLLIIFSISCSQQQTYEQTERELYCLPYFQGMVRNASTFNKVFIRDYPTKKEFTYTSEIGDTIISKGEVTHTKNVIINLKANDIIYRDNSTVPESFLLTKIFDSDETARIYKKSFKAGCINNQESHENLLMSDLDLLDKLSDSFLGKQTPQYQQFTKFETKGNIKARAYNHPQGTIYMFANTESSRTYKATAMDQNWEPKTYSIPTAVFVPKDAKEYFFLSRASKPKDGAIQENLKNMVPVRGAIEVIKEEDIFTPNRNSDTLFNQYLIYNGRSGNSVKFLYREFIGDLNRVSFQQEVSYDLNIGEIIGFKGARFKIIEANNVQLKYQVIETF